MKQPALPTIERTNTTTGPGRRQIATSRAGRKRRIANAVAAAPVVATAGAVLLACSAASRPTAEHTAESTMESALSATDVCALVNNAGKTIQQASGVLNTDIPINLSCSSNQISNLYYNGAEPLSDSVNDLFILPFVTDSSYFCAIADADGASVDGTLSGLGGFGVRSQFNVITRDPAHGHVLGRRVGTVVLFGVPAKLNVQDLDWTFPSEQATNDNQSWWGGYMALKSQGITWDVDASVTFPIGTIFVTIRPQFSGRGETRTQTNGGISFSPVRASNRLAPAYDYNTWLACAQMASTTDCSVDPSDVPALELVADHQVPCPGDITNLTDAVLPYYNPFGGAGCASQSFAFPDVLKNWFEFGRPSGALAEGEPDHTVTGATDPTALGNNATFWASLDVSTAFDVDIVSVALDTTVNLAGRDGFAVRQSHTRQLDGGGNNSVDVWTNLDAQSSASLTVNVTISFGDLVPSINDSFQISLGDTGNRESVPQTSTNPNGAITDLRYPDITPAGSQYTSLNEYLVNGQPKANPDQARLACAFATTPVNNTPVAPDDPGAYLKQVAKAAVDSIHPCQVRTCTDPNHEVDYNWDSSKEALVKGATGKCGICDAIQMSLCDAAGNRLPDPNVPGEPIVIHHGAPNPLPPGCVR